jgi:hypothetical protein
MRLAIAACAAALALPALAQTLPGSADQAKDVIIAPGTPTRPIVWAAKNAFQMHQDDLHYIGSNEVQIAPDLLARNRQARDRSLFAARSGLMQRYAAAQEAQQSAVGAGAPSSSGEATSR